MIGKGKITFSQQQMVRMVQHYLENEMFADGQCPSVTAVGVEGYSDAAGDFVIAIEGADKPEE